MFLFKPPLVPVLLVSIVWININEFALERDKNSIKPPAINRNQ